MSRLSLMFRWFSELHSVRRRLGGLSRRRYRQVGHLRDRDNTPGPCQRRLFGEIQLQGSHRVPTGTSIDRYVLRSGVQSCWSELVLVVRRCEIPLDVPVAHEYCSVRRHGSGGPRDLR